MTLDPSDLSPVQRAILVAIPSAEPHAKSSLPNGESIYREVDRIEGAANPSVVSVAMTRLKNGDLVECESIDGRTNGYRLTENGQAVLADLATRYTGALVEAGADGWEK